MSPPGLPRASAKADLPSTDLVEPTTRLPVRLPRTEEAIAALIADGGPPALGLMLRFAPETEAHKLVQRMLEVGMSLAEIAGCLELPVRDVGFLLSAPVLAAAHEAGLQARRRLIAEQGIEAASTALNELIELIVGDANPQHRLRAVEMLMGISGVSMTADKEQATVNVVNVWGEGDNPEFLTRLQRLRAARQQAVTVTATETDD